MTTLDSGLFQFRQNAAGLTVIPREDFARDYYDRKPGEHGVFGGASTHGKTSLEFALLKHVATPEFPAYVAVSKPHDPATLKYGRELGFRFVDQWPAPRKFSEIFGEKPRGYVVWPAFGDLRSDMERCADVTRTLLMDRYTAGVKRQKGLLVMDDTMIKAKVMGLDGEMVTILAMAGGMGIGMDTMVQKPTDSGRTPLWAYTMSTHKFFRHEKEKNMRRRYAEIANMDFPSFSEATSSLTEFQFLYVRDEYCCVVDKD